MDHFSLILDIDSKQQCTKTISHHIVVCRDKDSEIDFCGEVFLLHNNKNQHNYIVQEVRNYCLSININPMSISILDRGIIHKRINSQGNNCPQNRMQWEQEYALPIIETVFNIEQIQPIYSCDQCGIITEKHNSCKCT